jgi:tRNA pseudouridine55 synthase
VGEVVLGTETSTLDSAGDVTAVHEMGHVTLDDVVAAARAFVGDIQQIPPMVSAVKVGGRRLHELARQGIEVPREPRPVTIHSLEVGPGPEGEPGVYTLTVDCSSGTYIRTLAADLGHALGGGAHLRNLRRTSVGPFTLADAVPLENVGPERVLPMIEAVRHLPRITVGPELAAAVRVGKVMDGRHFGALDTWPGPWAVVDDEGILLAVYEPFRGDSVKPAVVLVG